jgi:magnesium transporter
MPLRIQLIKSWLDWIAHGILDSIVDSFFPLLKEIEKEVVAIDDMVFLDSDLMPPNQIENQCEVVISEKVDTMQDLQLPEKSAAHGPVTPFSSPRLTAPMVFRQFMRTANRLWKLIAAAFIGLQPTATQFTLRRIARTRKLVTLLTRLLATKSEVIAQIRKRLLTSSQSGLGNGTNRDEDVEVSIYLGDVQGMLVLTLFKCRSSKHLFASCLDHILTLQHSLAHYERMLSQSHPAYLSQLRTRAGFVRAGADKAAIYLTIVSLAVLCVQPLIGIYSMYFPGYFNTNSCYQDFYPLTSPFHKHLIPFMVSGS